MLKHEDTTCRSEAGFTLVELAVVMIIIGLLIGGVLKGQELISNAEVTATIAQVKGFDAATTTFRDKYDAMPGDMANPNTRLPNCTGPAAGGLICAVVGGGNGRVDTSTAGAAPLVEEGTFFVHLSYADLITGISAGVAGPAVWGDQFPDSEMGGGFHASYFNGVGGLFNNAGASAGHYLTLQLMPNLSNAASTALGQTMTPNQAFRIDNKIDDGAGSTGTVFATTAGCAVGPTYQEQLPQNICDVMIRFQN